MTVLNDTFLPLIHYPYFTFHSHIHISSEHCSTAFQTFLKQTSKVDVLSRRSSFYILHLCQITGHTPSHISFKHVNNIIMSQHRCCLNTSCVWSNTWCVSGHLTDKCVENDTLFLGGHFLTLTHSLIGSNIWQFMYQCSDTAAYMPTSIHSSSFSLTCLTHTLKGWIIKGTRC